MKRLNPIVLAFLLSLGLGGCTNSPVDEKWGSSFRETLNAQVADPAAPRSAEGPEGMDPVSAEAVSQRYYEGQRSQRTREAPAIVITDGN